MDEQTMEMRKSWGTWKLGKAFKANVLTTDKGILRRHFRDVAKYTAGCPTVAAFNLPLGEGAGRWIVYIENGVAISLNADTGEVIRGTTKKVIAEMLHLARISDRCEREYQALFEPSAEDLSEWVNSAAGIYSGF